MGPVIDPTYLAVIKGWVPFSSLFFCWGFVLIDDLLDHEKNLKRVVLSNSYGLGPSVPDWLVECQLARYWQ